MQMMEETRPIGFLRWIIFIVLALALFIVTPWIYQKLGWLEVPERPIAEADPDAVDPATDSEASEARDPDDPDEANGPTQAELTDASETDSEPDGNESSESPDDPLATLPPTDVETETIVLGAPMQYIPESESSTYKLSIEVDTRGAGIRSLGVVDYQRGGLDGHPIEGQPLRLITTEIDEPPSFQTGLLTSASSVEGLGLEATDIQRDLAERIFDESEASLTASSRVERRQAARQLLERIVTDGSLLRPGQSRRFLQRLKTEFYPTSNDVDSRLEKLLPMAEIRAIALAIRNVQERAWEIVLKDGSPIRQITRRIEGEPEPLVGQSIELRTTVGSGSTELILTKKYLVFEGRFTFEVQLTFEAPNHNLEPAYYQTSGHGLPLEGRWYSRVFRDALIANNQGGYVELTSDTAMDVRWFEVRSRRQEIASTEYPLEFFGVENQYFCSLMRPYPLLASDSPGPYADEVAPMTVGDQPFKDGRPKDEWYDINLRIVSRAVPVEAGSVVSHRYLSYSGPKNRETLESEFHSEAGQLADLRQWFTIPFSGFIARSVITPLLISMYEVTRWVSGLFGGQTGSYGVAIILLTVIVRLSISWITIRQALMAKKMQELAPKLSELKKKYGEDPRKLQSESWALYGKYGVNPLAGCLPALAQLPIFAGLWQALNNSPELRHSEFLYIDNLAAPDMLAEFPFNVELIPLVGGFIGPYFNLFPLITLGLFILQFKLLSPPPTTPEAQAQQQAMMILPFIMGFFFYKVPSGLCLYFASSTIWSMCERILVNRFAPKDLLKPRNPDEATNGKPQKKGFMARLQDAMEQAQQLQEEQKTQSNGVGSSSKANGSAKGGFMDKVRQAMEEAQRQQGQQPIRNEPKASKSPPKSNPDRPRPKRRKKR